MRAGHHALLRPRRWLLFASACNMLARTDVSCAAQRIAPVNPEAQARRLVPSDLSRYTFMLNPEEDRAYTLQEIISRIPRDSAMDDAADWAYIADLPKIDRRDQVPPAPPGPCPCSDVRLRAGFDMPPDPIGCFEQAQLGKCSDPAMMLTVDEVPEGYCQISCGRCDCCATVLEVLREQGFAALADAAVAVGLESILSNPGFETTMLAPSDTAMQRAAADLGHSTSPQLWSKAQRLFWRQVLLQHLLPPHPTYKALWTAPFLLDGVQLDTELHVKARQINSSAVMAPLTARAVSSGVFVQAQASIALVAPQELPACKAFVLEIDYPLLPFPAATPVDRQVLQPLQLPPTCLGELGANYQGEEIANAQLVDTPGLCCEACRAEPLCNVWVYCPAVKGCRSGAHTFKHRHCSLKQAPVDATAGAPAAWQRGATLPWISGTADATPAQPFAWDAAFSGFE